MSGLQGAIQDRAKCPKVSCQSVKMEMMEQAQSAVSRMMHLVRL